MTRPKFHEDPILPVHAYLDGELDPANALAVEKRMSAYPILAAECERVDALQQRIRAALPREAPPPGLRRRIETAVGLARPRPSFAQRQYSCCSGRSSHPTRCPKRHASASSTPISAR
jgi:anti-sigma factor RsiW